MIFPSAISSQATLGGAPRLGRVTQPGIEKQNATAPFVARDVRVPVQENIDIIRRSIRRNVLQAEFQPTSRKVENQRPLEIAVAISAHNRDARSDRPQLIENRFRANIAKMPDLISVFGHLRHALRQTIVRVRENKHGLSPFGFPSGSHIGGLSFRLAQVGNNIGGLSNHWRIKLVTA